MPTGHASRLMPTVRRVVLAGTAADRTDGQLLAAFIADRCGESFGELVRRHGPMVLGVCGRVTGDRTLAEDAFQAVFLVLARRAATVRPREQVGNWLYGVAYRTALKARAVLARRRAREKQVDVMPDPPAPVPPDAWSDLQVVIDEELARLPEKLRVPVVLCDLEGRPQREVARHLNVPPATLATRLAAARRTLAQRLTRRGVALSGGALAGLLLAHGTATAVPRALARGVTLAAEGFAGGVAPPASPPVPGPEAGVSAQAIQLSEGVIRMMMLAKLKAVAVTALTVLALTGGIGFGLSPAPTARADDEPAVKVQLVPAPPAPANRLDENVARKFQDLKPEGANLTDAEFLRRVLLDVCGVLPTPLEMGFFVADPDAKKREKVIDWLLAADSAREYAAKRLGVAPARVRLIRLPGTPDGASGRLIAVIETDEPRPHALAFSPDGKRLAVAHDVAAGLVWDRAVLADVDAHHTRATRVAGKQTQAGPNDSLWIDLDGATPEGDGPVRLFSWVADNDPGGRRVRVWDTASGKLLEERTESGGGDGKPRTRVLISRLVWDLAEDDAAFLRRATADVRGTPPTALEERYFTEDKDPKKREKLLDTLLKDPAVAKKLGEEWTKKMLSGSQPPVMKMKAEPQGRFFIVPVEPPGKALQPPIPSLDPRIEGKWKFEFHAEPKDAPGAPAKPPAPTILVPGTPNPPVPPTPQTNRYEKMVGELLAAKKPDAEILDGLSLVILNRLPTDTEKKLILEVVTTTPDRKAAWLGVANILAGSNEAKKPVNYLYMRVAPGQPEPPVPLAKP